MSLETYAKSGFHAAGMGFDQQKKTLEQEAMHTRNAHFLSAQMQGQAGAKRIPCPRLGSNNPRSDSKVGVLQFGTWRKKAELWWMVCGVSKSERLMLTVEGLEGEASVVAMQKSNLSTLSQEDAVVHLIEALREHYEGDFLANFGRSVDSVLECIRYR